MVEHAIRKAGKQSKISTQFQASVIDILREAHYWTSQRISNYNNNNNNNANIIKKTTEDGYVDVQSVNIDHFTDVIPESGLGKTTAAAASPLSVSGIGNEATSNLPDQYKNRLVDSPLVNNGAAIDQHIVSEQDVDKALAERIYRVNLMQEKIQELISKDKKLIIDVKGKAVGRLNGLAFFNTGDFAFGKPTRITSSTGLGRGTKHISRML